MLTLANLWTLARIILTLYSIGYTVVLLSCGFIKLARYGNFSITFYDGRPELHGWEAISFAAWRWPWLLIYGRFTRD